MRCPICDYSPDTPHSIFHSGLSLGRSARMTLDHETGEITCTCLESEVEYDNGEISLSTDEGKELWDDIE